MNAKISKIALLATILFIAPITPSAAAVETSHTVGLAMAFDAQTPEKSNAVVFNINGKVELESSKIARDVNYAGNFAANTVTKQQGGFIQTGIHPSFLPQILGVQARLQLRHSPAELKSQYDFGPTLHLFKTNVLGIATEANAAERIHAELPLIEHEVTFKARKNGSAVTVQGVLLTPLTKNGTVTERIYAEFAQDLAGARLQGMIGASASGQPGDFKNALQIVTGLRVFI